jgi:DNA-binding Lrp family transcriptional regulator
MDLKILAHLQTAARCSNVDLADAVGLSPSPCLVRVKRLQESGLIRGYSADLALEKLGEFVIVFSEITISNHRRQDFRLFEERVAKFREIVECYNVSGGYDYLMKIVTTSVGRFQKIMDELLAKDIGIEKFSSRIVLRRPIEKRGYPIDLIAAKRLRAPDGSPVLSELEGADHQS